MKSIFKGPAWLYLVVVNTPTMIFLALWLETGQPITAFIIFAIVDPFIFRPIMDYYRLIALDKIEKKDFRKMWKWGTLYRFKYYSTLMFGK